MPRQTAEPSFDRVYRLRHDREIPALNDLLGKAELFVCSFCICVPDSQGRCHIGLTGNAGTEFLQRLVGVGRLVGSISVDQDGSFIGHDLLEDGCDRLALGKPLPANAGNQAGGIDLVEQDRAG